jgi:hypothetical protein
VHAVAAEANADPAAILGRAIAHELGHLLIGTPVHSPHGLMRALWSQTELRRNRSDDWVFSADQADLMRRSAARSARAAN